MTLLSIDAPSSMLWEREEAPLALSAFTTCGLVPQGAQR